jgi:hypothetical protein
MIFGHKKSPSVITLAVNEGEVDETSPSVRMEAVKVPTPDPLLTRPGSDLTIEVGLRSKPKVGKMQGCSS